jgi:hypothetical protein
MTIHELRRPTHALSHSYVGNDGIRRIIYLTRLDDASVAIHFTTYWDGEDREPMETGLSLTPEAFNHFNHMIQAYHYNRERYAITETDPKADISGEGS